MGSRRIERRIGGGSSQVSSGSASIRASMPTDSSRDQSRTDPGFRLLGLGVVQELGEVGGEGTSVGGVQDEVALPERISRGEYMIGGVLVDRLIDALIEESGTITIVREICDAPRLPLAPVREFRW